MTKRVLFKTFISLLLPLAALAKSELMSVADWKTPLHTIHAELYFDPVAKRPDLWVRFTPEGAPKESFVATSISHRLQSADYRLKATPTIRMGKTTSFVFDAYDVKKNEWDGDHGFALIFHYRTTTADLTDPVIDQFDRQFPGAVVRKPTGEPEYIKALMTRVTWKQVYPVAAFNAEPKF